MNRHNASRRLRARFSRKTLLVWTLVVICTGVALVGPPAWGGEPAPAASAEPDVPQQPLTVFLVRHAEKVDDGRDPELSPAGRERAQALATTLRDAKLDHVHSSDYIRTRDTAAPIVQELELETELYDARDLPALVEKLQATGGRHLVVGHSNTTPEVVRLLGGDPGAPIVEAWEYDRLYVVTQSGEGEVSTVLLRFGADCASKDCSK